MSGGRPASAAAYLAAPQPGAATPWREATFSVVDLELTGLDPSVHEIVSFATVTVAGGRVKPADSIHRIVRPRRMPDPATIRIHGLRESDLEAAAPLENALDDLLAALTGRVLVAHAATVETGFLGPVLASRRLELRNRVVDTAALALELWRLRRQPPLRLSGDESAAGAVSSPGLSELARALGLPVHRRHHADGDALTTAQVFIALATHLERYGRVTVGSLERLSAPQRGRASVGSAVRGLLAKLRRR
jgi:DNA polymerase III subunit epsilon